jgi:uncharacterized caspase-like protein/Tfp pilus assembly protein PilF
MRAIASILCVALAAAQAPGQSLQIETPSTHRRGLVIGNAKYAHDPLENPVNDATSVGKLLRELGFAIDLKTNVDKEDMDHVIDDFVKVLGPGDVGLFYYAGHGFQIEGVNYLVPIDFNAWDDAAKAKYRALSASEIIERMEHSGTRLNIAIVDACRTNLGGSRGVSVGLASMNTGDNTFVALATAQGKTASDSSGSTGGKNGLFTAHLLEALQVPGLNLDDVFNQTREKVVLDSKSTQRPWTGSSVVGKFYFRSDNARTPIPAPVAMNPGSPRTIGPSFLKTALDLRAAHKPRESLDAFTREIRQNPRESQAFFERGKLYASLEQYDSAIVDFTDTLRLEPDNGVAYHARGVAYLSKGEYLRALPDFDQATERLPRDATVFFNRGIAYAHIDRQQQAIESYNQALAIRPDYADALANRAFSYASSGKLRQALEDCNQAIHIKPSLGTTYRNRAKIKRLLGDPAGAAADEKLASKLK